MKTFLALLAALTLTVSISAIGCSKPTAGPGATQEPAPNPGAAGHDESASSGEES